MQLIIIFPQSTREAIITRWQLIALSLPLAFSYLIAFTLLCCVVLLWEPVMLDGVGMLADADSWLPFVLEELPWVMIPFFVIICLLVIRGAFKQKCATLPTRYGFDEQGIYIYNALGALRLTWVGLAFIRETRSFLLFRNASQTFLWPKAPWSPEELAELRALCKRGRAKGKPAQS